MTRAQLSEKAAREVDGLRDLSRDQLVNQWASLFGQAPPKRLTLDLLVRGIAYERQVHELGGLSSKERKKLAAIAEGRSALLSTAPSNGTRLYRSWQGMTHEVLVSKRGYCWQGQTYSSLSSVARAITGTHWSGPRFFGVKA